MKRGEIYLIKRRDCIGSEIMKTRPAVIVSNNALNAASEVVEVVYLTTQPKKDRPEHVHINATGVPSVAVCEQIDSVSLRLVCSRVGTCSEEEMEAIDKGLMCSLGIETPKDAEPQAVAELSEGERWLMQELAKMETERDRYAKMVDALLAGAKV